ncbi:hypothetical protein NL676_037501 [Syzygium grande]|nr:hypothetical protein NL676_037501 [Syzygium grande]
MKRSPATSSSSPSPSSSSSISSSGSDPNPRLEQKPKRERARRARRAAQGNAGLSLGTSSWRRRGGAATGSYWKSTWHEVPLLGHLRREINTSVPSEISHEEPKKVRATHRFGSAVDGDPINPRLWSDDRATAVASTWLRMLPCRIFNGYMDGSLHCFKIYMYASASIASAPTNRHGRFQIPKSEDDDEEQDARNGSRSPAAGLQQQPQPPRTEASAAAAGDGELPWSFCADTGFAQLPIPYLPDLFDEIDGFEDDIDLAFDPESGEEIFRGGASMETSDSGSGADDMDVPGRSDGSAGVPEKLLSSSPSSPSSVHDDSAFTVGISRDGRFSFLLCLRFCRRIRRR